MAAIHELLKQVQDPALRARLTEEFNRATQNKKFGLVFEEHMPECTPLYGIGIKRGSTVARKAAKINDTFTVINCDGDSAICRHKTSGTIEKIAKEELVVAAEFGEPIFPYLEHIDSVENAPDSGLWHTLIEADNYHALQLLEYLYPQKVDCIYIDPPYNTGARDWKYNNDYVDASDSYRHSKWLSMMKKRLKLAKRLLNPEDSVLIVTIDEKEYLHLGCLLEEMFPEARMQMVSSVINPSGVAREGEFYRTDEYIFILQFGNCVPAKLALSEEWVTARTTGKDSVRWRPIRRQGSHDTRHDAPNQFYPIFLSKDGSHVIGTGDSLGENQHISDLKSPDETIVIWPIKPDGTEGCWQISQSSVKQLLRKGYIKVTYSKKWGYVAQYLAEGERHKVETGLFPILGKDKQGTLILGNAEGEGAPFIPGTQWRISSHSAREQGASLLNRIFPSQRFSFPKSLYAEHDVIRFFVENKPNALIVDFFAGSGTTLHAVNLLNAEDGGRRRCIMVTNNEVSDDEAKTLKKHGFHPGDEEWEKLGIARYVTWPRTVCSIEGHDINGNPLKGNYLGSDIPMSDGFAANCEYFKLGFLDKDMVSLGRQFQEILPLLWMKSGAVGKRPEYPAEEEPVMLVLPENHFAVLVEEACYAAFAKEVRKYDSIETVYFITNSENAYHEMAQDLGIKESYQLYRSYLDNFVIGARRDRI